MAEHMDVGGMGIQRNMCREACNTMVYVGRVYHEEIHIIRIVGTPRRSFGFPSEADKRKVWS